MRLRILISLSALLPSLLQTVWAQSANDLFHGGAQFYLSNNIPGALEQAENGLRLYPEDVKLKKLEELLKRQNQQNQNQKQDQQQQKQQQANPPPEKKDQNQPEPQPAQKPSGKEKKPEPNEKPESSPASAAGKMTPQEAKQMLDSQKNNEMLLPVSRKQKASDQERPVKDW